MSEVDSTGDGMDEADEAGEMVGTDETDGMDGEASGGDDGEAAPKEDPGFLTVSNLLSLTRIPLAFVFLASDDTLLLAAVVAVGAATDLADGLVARLTGTQSRLGALLDPFCDKLFVVVGLASFLPAPELGWAGFVVLILRDIFTVGAYATGLIVGKVVPFTSRLGGKITTALQVFTLFALIFDPRWVPLLVVVVAAASLYAIADYGNQAIRGLQRRERAAA